MGSIKYIEIDGESGLAEFSLIIHDDAKYSIVLGDLGGSGEYVGLQLGETSTTAYRGDRGKIAYDHSLQPHAALGEPIFTAWLNSNPLDGFLTEESDPIFNQWLNTNPLSQFLTQETDPIFQQWLAANPLAEFLTEETDPIFQQWLATNPLNGFITDAPSDNEKYSRKNQTWTVINEGISNIFVEKDPIYPIDYLKFTLNGNDYSVTEIPKANGILVGGIVGWIGGLSFSISSAAFYIGGNLYGLDDKNVTSDVADTVYPRIDIIVINTDSEAFIIKGVPSENPQKPTPDPLTQIELTEILIPANATEPGNEITTVVIYDENIEWSGSVSGSGVIGDFDNLTSPFKGNKCANISNLINNSLITFSNVTDYAPSDYGSFSMMLKLKTAATSQHNLTLQFYDDNDAKSNEFVILFNKTYVNVWQTIAIPFSSFQFTGGTFNKIVLKWTKQGSQVVHTGLYLDYIKIEEGLNQPVIGLEADPVFTQWKNSMYGIGAKQTGIDAGILHQRSITDDYEYVCVQGGIAGVAIWKKIVLFQT